MSVTRDTSHFPIGPYGLLEQSPCGDSSRHETTALSSSFVDCGENAEEVFGLFALVFGLVALVFGLVALVFGLVALVFGLVALVFGVFALNPGEQEPKRARAINPGEPENMSFLLAFDSSQVVPQSVCLNDFAS